MTNTFCENTNKKYTNESMEAFKILTQEDFLDNRFINSDGDSMRNSLNMGGFKIENLGEPINEKDCVTKSYCDHNQIQTNLVLPIIKDVVTKIPGESDIIPRSFYIIRTDLKWKLILFTFSINKCNIPLMVDRNVIPEYPENFNTFRIEYFDIILKILYLGDIYVFQRLNDIYMRPINFRYFNYKTKSEAYVPFEAYWKIESISLI